MGFGLEWEGREEREEREGAVRHCSRGEEDWEVRTRWVDFSFARASGNPVRLCGGSIRPSRPQLARYTADIGVCLGVHKTGESATTGVDPASVSGCDKQQRDEVTPS